jgi:hypothetical protein
MAKEPAADALDRVRLLAAAGLFTDISDGDLLNRCAAGPDEPAFTALVERHGAMVYGVCFRILRNPATKKRAISPSLTTRWPTSPAIVNPPRTNDTSVFHSAANHPAAG